MKEPLIVIDLDPDGSVTVGVEHVKGPACEELTRFLTEGLGTVTKSTRTAEYYEKPATTRQHHQQTVRRKT